MKKKNRCFKYRIRAYCRDGTVIETFRYSEKAASNAQNLLRNYGKDYGGSYRTTIVKR